MNRGVEPIPVELFPEQQDIEALETFYSESTFSRQSSLDFWKRTLAAVCIHNRRLTFTVENAMHVLTLRNRVPASLPKALPLLVQSSEVVARSSIAGKSMAGTVFTTALSATSLFIPFLRSNPMTDEHVSVSLMKSIEREIIGYLQTVSPDVDDGLVLVQGYSRADERFSFQHLLRRVAAQPHINDPHTVALLSRMDISNDIPVLIDYLLSKRACVVSDDGSIMKIFMPVAKGASIVALSSVFWSPGGAKSKAQSATSPQGRAASLTVDEIDVGKMRLRCSIGKLEKRIDDLNVKAVAYHNQALASSRGGDKHGALLQLKLKKTCEASREPLSSALIGLQASIQVS
jgi:hypothetical protein